MLAPSWDAELRQTLSRLSAERAPEQLRIAVVGIGQALRGDDGGGSAIAQRLRAQLPRRGLVQVLDGGAAPENQTVALRRFWPALVLLVDAAELEATPGTVRWLPWQTTSGMTASTHTLPPYLLASFLTATLKCEVYLIGLQPADTTLGAPLTPVVGQAVLTVADTLASLLFPYAIMESQNAPLH